MKNQDRYKTVEERKKAFDDFCEMECIRCPIHGDSTHGCFENPMEGVFIWLELEAEEEKPLPCPFCGGECKTIELFLERDHYVVCDKCRYASARGLTEVEAIAAHNRMAKAVKESEESK